MENSKTLWIFGDSYSAPWDKLSGTHKEYVDKHNPKYHFANILQKELGCDALNNLAVSGWDNYSIMESVGTVISKIKPQDYVIIGWSETVRYRNTYMRPGKWTTISVNFDYNWFYKNPLGFDMKHWEQESVARDCALTSKEIDSWVALLHHAIPNNLLNWTLFKWPKKYSNGIVIPINVNRPTCPLPLIKDNTDIEDYHITDEAHLNLGNWMVDILENNLSCFKDNFNELYTIKKTII